MSKDEAVARAKAGLAFMQRHQVRDDKSGDLGRFPMIYNCTGRRLIRLSTNWTTGVAVQAFLAAHRLTGDQPYLDAAGLGVGYIKSLQAFSPTRPRMVGTFHEICPQSVLSCPRDATTAAWALWDWSKATGDADARERSLLFADWFLRVGMETGIPYWNSYFDDRPWDPPWSGSFHIGEAIYLCRLYQDTHDRRYREAAERIGLLFADHHLDERGRITVSLLRDGLGPVPEDDPGNAAIPDGWRTMHEYNSDFGAVACLALNAMTGQKRFAEAGRRFLDRMLRTQRDDGGFGPPQFAVPSAGGMVPVEMMAWASLEASEGKYAGAVERAMAYLASIQWRERDSAADGAFLGVDDNYQLQPDIYNIRTAAYAIMALLRYGGGIDPFDLQLNPNKDRPS